MFSLFVTIFLITCLISISNSQWIKSTPDSNLPIATYDQAIGVYNKSIYLLGGNNNSNNHQFIQYTIADASNSFIDHSFILPSVVNGNSQFYTQIDHKLYMKNPLENVISTFDMKSQIFIASYINNIPTNTGHHSCLASTPNRLFIVGGALNSDALNLVQMYDLVNNEWLGNAPSMNEDRVGFSCIIHPQTNMLYVFGGDGTTSIETIYTDDILTQSWNYIDPLSQVLGYTRSVIYNDIILIIGGAYETSTKSTSTSSWYTVDIIHVLNTLTNEVSILSDRLPLYLSNVAPVVVDHTLYVFGGFDGNGAVDDWMMYDLLNAFPMTESTVSPYDTTTEPANIVTNSTDLTSALASAASSTLYSIYVPIPSYTEHFDVRTSSETNSKFEWSVSFTGKQFLMIAACIVLFMVLLASLVIMCLLCMIHKQKMLRKQNTIEIFIARQATLSIAECGEKKRKKSSLDEVQIVVRSRDNAYVCGQKTRCESDDVNEIAINPNISNTDLIIKSDTEQIN